MSDRERQRRYSTWGRPFRLQLSASAAAGFDGAASRGRCQFPECRLFEWATGRVYCREHWLLVHEQSRLPEHDGKTPG
jgi:hypothetical protein